MLQIEEDLTMRPVNIMIHEMSYVEERYKDHFNRFTKVVIKNAVTDLLMLLFMRFVFCTRKIEGRVKNKLVHLFGNVNY